MPTQNRRKDPQDQEFGTAAAADQELVDELADEGVDGEQLPDRPDRTAPRAGGKAEPAPD